MKNDFTERLFYKIGNTILIFFAINIYFLFANALFIVTLILIDARIENILFYLISLIPTGPALAASFSAMNKMLEEKDINAASVFIKAYRTNFKQASKYWTTLLSIMAISIINYTLVGGSDQLRFLVPLFLVVMFLILTTSLYAFPLITKFHLNLRSLWIISLLSVYKYWLKTIVNLLLTVSFIMLFFQFPLIITFSFGSIIPYIIMNNLKGYLIDIESTYFKNSIN